MKNSRARAKPDKRGFWLSVEAIACLALLGMLFAAGAGLERPGFLDLHLFKKENDLLLAWAKQYSSLNEARIVNDVKFAFPGKSALVFFDGKKFSVGKAGPESVASGAVFFDKEMKRHELRLVVFKQSFQHS